MLAYTPPGAADGPVLGLVGKGITFDTGGISIKPADGMDRMKDDMAGGAAVVCGDARDRAARGADAGSSASCRPTENMPGGRAIKPGDVLRSADGKTVEVINTDAEGRLILGDGLWYARQLGATHLVDVATLTGACVVALGQGRRPGCSARRRRGSSACAGAADRAGDPVLADCRSFDDYREQLKSDIADMINTGGRPAGAITAAMFLKEFAGGAAVGAPRHRRHRVGRRGASRGSRRAPTGVAVRTLAELAFASDLR